MPSFFRASANRTRYAILGFGFFGLLDAQTATPGQILQLSPTNSSGTITLPFTASGSAVSVTDAFGNQPSSTTITFTYTTANPNQLAVSVDGSSLLDKVTVFFVQVNDTFQQSYAYYVVTFSYGSGPVSFVADSTTNSLYPNNRIALTRANVQAFPQIGPGTGIGFQICAGTLYSWAVRGSELNCNDGTGASEDVVADWLYLALQPWQLVSPVQGIVSASPGYYPPGLYEGYVMLLDSTGKHVIAFAEVDYWNYNVLTLPHFAVGGSFITGITVVNTGATPGNFNIAFYGDNGQPASLPFSGVGSVTSLSATIPAGQEQYYEAGNSSFAVIGGWGQVTADPSITIQALFRNLAPDGNYYEAAVPVASSGLEVLIPYDATVFAATGAQIYTGLAIANTDASNQANVVCTAINSGGTVIPNAVTVPVLPKLGHWANFLFPALNGTRGTLDCVSNTNIAAVGLRFLGNNAFSSLPVVLRFP